MKNSEFREYFSRVSETLKLVDTSAVEKLADLLLKAREQERTIFIFGNGGSGATASHVTGDFLKGISYQMDKRFRVMCLNDNISGMMAISNDLTYEEIFIEQLKTFVRKNDVVIGISGSGNSVNVVKALEYARSSGAVTVAFCGFKGGKVKEIADLLIHAPIQDMEVTEDIHIVIFHAIKQSLIMKLKGKDYSMGGTYDKRVKQ
ncbi:MAG TPA: SIS domain-containing protein [Bacteroidales bacterium]|nr:SIS domain-containing protein [Bacteroidales bacterium]